MRQFLGAFLGVVLVGLCAGTKAWAAESDVIDTGTTAWMLTSTALVLLMVPGLAMFYGGLVRTKNVLGTMMHSFISIALIGILWMVCGYALCFGKSVAGGIIGWDPRYLFLNGIDNSIVHHVPEYVIAMFQGKFAIIAPALIAGALAERVYFRGYCLFISLWFLLVYCPLCHWIWAPGGWLHHLGAAGTIDLAGGFVIHISAGISALVVALFLGVRRGYPHTGMRPNNLVMTMIGAGLLWVGWFGFNAGSTVDSGLDTARALTMTQIAAASGALTWTIIEALKFNKATSLGFVSGILAGLVAITPAAGVVQPVGALILGAVSSVFCYLALQAKSKLTFDDSLDCFGVHGVGSSVGALLLAFFIRKSWMMKAAAAGGSWSAGQQFLVQLTAWVATALLAAVMTYLICLFVEKTVGFRLDKRQEMAGMDHALHGEHGYGMLGVN